MPELTYPVSARLPMVCYAFIGTKAPGQRIVMLRAGVRGYAQTDLDDESMTHAMACVLTDKANVGLGVTDAQQQAMLAGAVYGFHVPLANPAHPYHNGRYSKCMQSSISQFWQPPSLESLGVVDLPSVGRPKGAVCGAWNWNAASELASAVQAATEAGMLRPSVSDDGRRGGI